MPVFGKGVVGLVHEPPLPYRGGGLLAAQSHGGGFTGQFLSAVRPAATAPDDTSTTRRP